VLLALSSSQKLVILLAAAAFVAFALVSAVAIPRSRPDFPSRHLGWFIALSVLFTVGMLSTVFFVARETGTEEATAQAPGSSTPTTSTTTAPTTTESSPTAPTPTGGNTTETTTPVPAGDAAAGKVVFKTNCGGCHTLADAGTTGTVGPNLDQKKPDAALVLDRVTNGKGAMPAWKGTLTDTQIADVVAYVSTAAGS
jgi:mono/diheme cytochrome c family protein